MNIVFAGYKEGYLCFKSTSVVVNFCWSELSTVSGKICCTLENTYYIQCMILPESAFTAFWTLSISWSREYSCANSLNISVQTFCVIGYQKDNRTFCVSEYWAGHRTDHRTDHGTDCWIEWINLTVSYIGQVRVVSLLYHCMYH